MDGGTPVPLTTSVLKDPALEKVAEGDPDPSEVGVRTLLHQWGLVPRNRGP